jgi:hypothetical protein
MINDIFTATNREIKISEKDTPDDIFFKVDSCIHDLVGEEVTVRVFPKIKHVKNESGGFDKVKATEEDVKNGELVNKSGFLLKTDKNGYVVHSLKLCEKVDLDSATIHLSEKPPF